MHHFFCPLRPPALLVATLMVLLTGCEQLGIEDPAKEAARREAEGKAIGSACRHSGRALEDCFTLNTSADKAAIFTGWREMNDYMTQNKIESVRPEIPALGLAKKKARTQDEDTGSASGADANTATPPAAAPAVANTASASGPGEDAPISRLRQRMRDRAAAASGAAAGR